MNKPKTKQARTLDERDRLYRLGRHWALKNGRGEYAALSVLGCALTNEVKCAARVRDPANLDYALARKRAADPTWRIVRLLDHRWN